MLLFVVYGTAPVVVAAAQTNSNDASGNWTVYHGDPQGDGTAASVTSVDLTSAGPRGPWTVRSTASPSPGTRVYVTSESDTVYVLSAATGDVAWSAHLGTPVPSSALPCGDISPTVGITGTPVVDAGGAEVFVVTDELVDQHPAHELVGLDAVTGKVELTQVVDPPGSTPAALLQRTGLALDGDRGRLRLRRKLRRLLQLPRVGDLNARSRWHRRELRRRLRRGREPRRHLDGGAAPIVDSGGNIWVESGNGSVTSPGAAYDHSDAVLELSPALALLQYFVHRRRGLRRTRAIDRDLARELLDDGEVVAAGKDGAAYLLDGARLGGIGGEQSSVTSVCAGHRWWFGHRQHHGLLPALSERSRGGAVLFQPGPPSPFMEGGCRDRATDRGGGPGVEHRPERDPLRAQRDHGRRGEAGEHRRAGEITSRRPRSATVYFWRPPPKTSSPSTPPRTARRRRPRRARRRRRVRPGLSRARSHLLRRAVPRPESSWRSCWSHWPSSAEQCGCGAVCADRASPLEDQRAESTSSRTVLTPPTSSEIDAMTAITFISGRCIGSQSPTSSNTSSVYPSSSAQPGSSGARSSIGRGSRVAT